MAYNWGGVLKAPSPFDGQVWVDQDLHVWQWNSASQAWNRAPHIQMQRAYSRFHPIAGRPSGYDFLPDGAEPAPKAGRLGYVWDEAYELSFVEVRGAASGTLYGRRAHMSRAEMLAWVGSVVPAPSGYTDNIVLTVYEAVDTVAEMPKWHVWNGLYSSFRGRECYFGANGHGRSTLPARAGYSPDFAAYHGVDLEYFLLARFYGKVPASPQPRVCWSTNARRGVYRHPNNTTARVTCDDSSKYVWNNATDSWEPSPVGDEYVHDPTAGSNPLLLWRSPDSTILHLESMTSAVRGLSGILGEGAEGREAVVVRAMRNRSNNNLKAFVIKPYGVTAAAWNMTAGNADLLALSEYDGCATGGVNAYNLTRNGLVEERGERGLRYNLTRMYSALYVGHSSPYLLTHDTPAVPEEVRFYLRDRTTGVRSPTSRQCLYLERRRATVPVAIMFRHS